MKKIKIGLLCPFPPEKVHQGYYALNIIKNTKENTKFIKIGTLKSDSNYNVNFHSIFLKEKLEKIIKKESLDILHIQYIPPFFGSIYLNLNLIRVYSLNIKIITTLHEVYFNTKSIRNKYLSFLEQNILRKSSMVIVHNNMMTEFLTKKYKTRKINTIILGHILKKYKRKIGKNILFFGILSPGKGVEYLIEAMKNLPKLNLLIAGSTPNSICINYAKTLKESASNFSNITIKTKKWFSSEEKNNFYYNSDIVVLPYKWGPYNSAIIQDAVENVKPIVVTKIGAIFDLVERFKLGEIVKSQNSKEIDIGILNCYSKYRNYQKNIEKFRNSVTWPNNGKKHLEVYKKALGD